MLKIIGSADQLPYGPIMDIYECSNRENGKRNYPRLAGPEQLLLSEQDFYAYLQNILNENLGMIAIWSAQNRAVAALRLEKYRDGLLLAGIETAPAERRKGYAASLVHAVVKHFPNCKIYSHIFNENRASTDLHIKCGFKKISDKAVLLDGSTTNEASTYLCE